MANSRSAAKRVRKTRTETARNRVVRTRVKAYRKVVAAAIESGDADAATKALKEFSSMVDRAAKRNIVHRNAASRQKSNLTRQIQAASAS